jgi:DNA-binding response OmpR family regulator
MECPNKDNFKHSILILEDDLKLASLITQVLSKDGFYKIHTTHSIAAAQELLNSKYFDLVCLDLLLPDGRGESLCEEIRKNTKFALTKIIVISQRNSIHDRIEILEQDIDDYLPKPFYPGELRIRIKKLLGLTKPKLCNSKINVLKLDYNKKVLSIEENYISLTDTEFLILKFIFENNGFANKDLLLKFLSQYKKYNVSKTSLATAINRIQKKCKRQTGKTFLKNKYGVGYYIL